MIAEEKRQAKILVVDDDKDFRETICDLLKEEGHEVIGAEDGKRAIKEVEEDGFHIIFMDIKLPNMNGTEAFKVIKEISPKTATVMMTGYSVEDLVKEALAHGAQGCLYKPFPLDEMLARIEKALGCG